LHSPRHPQSNMDETSLNRGIDLINSLLEPGSKVLRFLSADEATGMREIQNILMSSKQEKHYTPREICNIEGDDGGVNNYLVQAFGGKRKTKLAELGKSICSSIRFLSQNKSITLTHKDRVAEEAAACTERLYVPPEFLQFNPQRMEHVRNLLDCDNLELWTYDTPKTSLATNGHPLLFIGWAILGAPHAQKAMANYLGVEPPDWVHDLVRPDHFEFLDEFKISSEVLCNFLRAVEAGYKKENAYHNNIHGADVLQTTYSMLKMGGVRYSGGTLDIFSLLVAAACHDMGHPGMNNVYQINTKSDLATIYNDQSVLENMHAASAFKLLTNSSPEMNLDITSGLSPNQYDAFRTIVVQSIITTDMSKHFSSLASIKSMITNIGTDDPHKFFTTEHKSISMAMQVLLHAADISNPAKPETIAREWADLCLEEFFAQGDEEKRRGLDVSPLCDRDTTDLCGSQIGFIKFVVKPMFEVVGKLVPMVAEVVEPMILENLKYWEDRKEIEGV